MRPRLGIRPRRIAAGLVASVLPALGLALVAAPALAGSACADGMTPALLSKVICTTAGNYTLTLPAGTTSVDLDIVGGGGGPGYAASYRAKGGDAARVTGTASLP